MLKEIRLYVEIFIKYVKMYISVYYKNTIFKIIKSEAET